MEGHRLRAPSADGGLLADPPLAQAGGILAENARRLAAWDHDFQGRPVGHLRALARAQAFDLARTYLTGAGLEVPEPLDPARPLIVTGHQPELFHPGVWVKNFAAGAIARAQGGLALNFLVDDDLPKSAAIRVPGREEGEVVVRPFEFDTWDGEHPYEDWVVRDEARFASFGERVRAALDPAVSDPLIARFWPRALQHSERTRLAGLRFALARRETEATWGLHNLEVPLGQLCESEPFLWFACHLLAHAGRFRQVHNEALARYRGLYKIRSRQHPVPALTGEGEWIETPFWGWRASAPRRRPLLVRQAGKALELRLAGDPDPLIEVPLGPDREACCAVERLLGLPAQGVRLRTRALTTTMFARLILGDLFLHGIGGAKYDELGDEVARGFFGFDPPAFLTISLTLRLGLVPDPATPEVLEQVERALRTLEFSPERTLDGESLDGAGRSLVESKREALALPVGTHRQRAARFFAIRRANEALAGRVADQGRALAENRQRLRAGLERNRKAGSREYAAVLYDEPGLRAALARAVGPWDGPGKI